jgi:FtsP/CotA-like multicopper oxidase with cupredoxin domain
VAGVTSWAVPRSLRAGTGGPAVRLVAAPGAAPLVGDEGPPTPVWAYNGQVPGPLIRARQGERLTVEVINRLDEPTTVHWHGLRVPAAMDGVPWLSQPPIASGETFTYTFDLEDAGTFWYHPHINGSAQVGRGLRGVLIVDELTPPAVGRDLLWVIDDWRLDQRARIAPFGAIMDASHAGRLGNVATVNGGIAMDQPVRGGERLRLRLANVANARTFALRFGELPLWLIALDGHPVPPLRPTDNRVVLGAGMRADVILDVPAEPSASVTVVDDAYGPERAFELMRLRIASEPPLRDGPLPAPESLQPNPVAEPDLDAAERHRVVFEGGAMGGMTGARMGERFVSMRELAEAGRLWAINGTVPEDLKHMPSLLTLERGTSHRLELVNRTAFDHPIHLHGHAFRMLSTNGAPVAHAPFRDTVLLAPDDTTEIAFVADNPGQWMFHCHILEHLEAGMMAVVDVS